MVRVNKQNKGFTLIELLVVIAIIGILASVVLASLRSSRESARDVRVKQELVSLSNQMELYRNANGSYGANGSDDDSNACRGANATSLVGSAFKDSVIMGITTIITSNMNTSFRPYCEVRNNTWAFSVPLFDQSKASGGNEQGWCVDSTGARKEVIFDMSGMAQPLRVGAIARCP